MSKQAIDQGSADENVTARAQRPQGQRLALNISPNFLNPEAGPRVAEMPRGSSERCGLLWGTVDYGFEHPNHQNKEINSIRWHGTFGWQKADGTIGGGSTAYFPAVIERQLHGLGALIYRDPEPPPPRQFWAKADFSVEVWCERVIPKPGRPGSGFQYVVYKLDEPERDISHLAPPEVRALLPAPRVERPERLIAYYADPETGEVTEEREIMPDPAMIAVDAVTEAERDPEAEAKFAAE